MKILPELGLINPRTILSVVLFPAPLGPKTHKYHLCLRELILLTALKSPNDL